MIIKLFKVKNIVTILDQGNFDCSVCRYLNRYSLKQIRNYIHFLYVPIIPLKIVKTFIECEMCKTIFLPEILFNSLPIDQKQSVSVVENNFNDRIENQILLGNKIVRNEQKIIKIFGVCAILFWFIAFTINQNVHTEKSAAQTDDKKIIHIHNGSNSKQTIKVTLNNQYFYSKEEIIILNAKEIISYKALCNGLLRVEANERYNEVMISDNDDFYYSIIVTAENIDCRRFTEIKKL